MHPQLSETPAKERRIILRQAEDGDFASLAEIRRDPSTQSMLMTVADTVDDEAVRSWIARRCSDMDGAFRIIADAASDCSLGFVQISQVHRRNRHGYGGLALCPGARGRGLGHETVHLLLSLAFKELGLDKLMLEVREDNVVALGIYRAAGFRHVGRLEKHFRDQDGQMYDVLLLERLFTAQQS